MAAIKIAKIAEILKKGGIGVFPTDTMYGLIGCALNEKAVRKIYRLRKRNPKKPLIILISSLKDFKALNISANQKQKNLLKKYWPGPVSVILPCLSKKMAYLHRGSNSLAVRMPKTHLLVKLLKLTGPLVAPSANFEGQMPAQTVREAKKFFNEKISFYYDGGKKGAVPSTLLSLTAEKPLILRQGLTKIPLPKS